MRKWRTLPVRFTEKSLMNPFKCNVSIMYVLLQWLFPSVLHLMIDSKFVQEKRFNKCVETSKAVLWIGGVKDMGVETGRRAAGLSKWKELHQSRGIPAFSSSFFCYSLERVSLFFLPSALSLRTLGQIKEEREETQRERRMGGRGGDRKTVFYWACCSM